LGVDQTCAQSTGHVLAVQNNCCNAQGEASNIACPVELCVGQGAVEVVVMYGLHLVWWLAAYAFVACRCCSSLRCSGRDRVVSTATVPVAERRAGLGGVLGHGKAVLGRDQLDKATALSAY
jgi:hypothetical protein